MLNEYLQKNFNLAIYFCSCFNLYLNVNIIFGNNYKLPINSIVKFLNTNYYYVTNLYIIKKNLIYNTYVNFM